ncbi:MAG: hypothetical protein R3E95_14240 [Thiolinea sp.]
MQQAVIPRYLPNIINITGYNSQIRFFQQQYPQATLHIQRGKEVDVIKPVRTTDVSACVQRVDIGEQGYLKGGLKRRVAYRLIIKPGVELCLRKTKN